MRQLQNEDMYILSEIVDKMDLTLPKMPKVASEDKSDIEQIQKNYGIELISTLVKKIHKAKPEINQLLANVTEQSIEDVSKMSIKDTITTLKSILKQDGVLDFLK